MFKEKEDWEEPMRTGQQQQQHQFISSQSAEAISARNLDVIKW